MLKPISALVVAGMLVAAAPDASADRHRHERAVHGHDRHIAYVVDRHRLTHAERRDLRQLRRVHSRQLSLAERRYLRRLERRIALVGVSDTQYLRRYGNAGLRFRHNARGRYCR